MRRGATRGDAWRESFVSSESESRSLARSAAAAAAAPEEGRGGGAARPLARRSGPVLWSTALLSALGSVVAVASVGCFCALVYPILRELRAERVRGEDGTDERILGFWSILVLSLLAGCVCSVFSWTLTYLDSDRTGAALPSARIRDVSGHGFHVGNGVAVLNGIMAMLTVIWSLT